MNVLSSMEIAVTVKLLYSRRSLSLIAPPRARDPIMKVGGVARHDMEFFVPTTRILSNYPCKRLFESMGF